MADKEWRRDAAAALRFEEGIVPHLLRPWTGELIRFARVPRGGRVLDLACGTGLVAREVSATEGIRSGIFGVDFSPEMLSVARKVAAEASGIRFTLADAASLPFPDGTFDAVLCQQGLQFFADRPLVLREIGRVLRSGGVFGASVWGREAENAYFAAIHRAVDRYLGKEAGRMFEAPFALGEPELLKSLLDDAGFEEVEVRRLAKTLRLPPLVEFIPRHLGGTSVAALFVCKDAETRRALAADVVADLESQGIGAGGEFPFMMNFARGRART